MSGSFKVDKKELFDLAFGVLFVKLKFQNHDYSVNGLVFQFHSTLQANRQIGCQQFSSHAGGLVAIVYVSQQCQLGLGW